MVTSVTPGEDSRMRVIPRVSFSRCGLLLPSGGGGVSSMARVPDPRAAGAAAGPGRERGAGRDGWALPSRLRRQVHGMPGLVVLGA